MTTKQHTGIAKPEKTEREGAQSSHRAMINRCTQPSCGSYERYGGAGVTVAPEWTGRGGFDRFYSHIGPRPSGHTLDRKENSRGYEPGNVRWLPKAEQARNRRKLYEIDGEHKTMIEWCEIHGASYAVVQSRVSKYGWDIAEAVRTPAAKRGCRPKRAA